MLTTHTPTNLTGFGLWALLLAVGLGPAPAAHALSAEYLGSVIITDQVGGVGGLSDLAYDPIDEHWVLLSDEGRAFAMHVDLSDGTLDPGDAVVVAELPLNLSGSADDPEGLDIDAEGTWWISAEGNANRNDAEGGGYEPFVGRLDPVTGDLLEELPLPTAFDPIAPNGIRHNLGFEGVAVSQDGGLIFTAAEEGLSQDELADGSSRLTRLLRYDLNNAAAVTEYPYVLAAEGVQNGLVGLLTIGDRLIAMERAATFSGFSIRLYNVDLSRASDVSGMFEIATDAEAGLLTFARKTRLLDLARLDLRFDNIEGIALGPRIRRSRVLLMVADDGDPFSQNRLVAIKLTFDKGRAVGSAGR